ncbi:GNAT family N-acetyltransferase [Corynebacterium kroppenstedtii]|uniref:GNAT family N-acetyltransferase n=1 Tax=Corynebacterium sp. PCR 32 TaxID=3351342 RepID=UPI0030B2C2A7
MAAMFTGTIRPMTSDDYPEVARIHQAGLDTGNGAYESAPVTWEEFTDKKIRELCFVAEADGRILGWVSLMPFYHRPSLGGFLEDSIYIDPDAAGRGVGTALLAHCTAKAKEWGAWTITAWIYDENSASQALHAKAGFRKVGTLHRHGWMEHGPWADQYRRCTIYEKLL